MFWAGANEIFIVVSGATLMLGMYLTPSVLRILLLLEGVMLLALSLSFFITQPPLVMLLLILGVGVCEACLGMSLLVFGARLAPPTYL